MTTRFFNHKNGQIAYDVTGEGPLVVCVPSLGDVRGEYRFLVQLLAKAGYRVATMDVRGHGETSTEWDDFSVAAIGEDIVALVRELNVGPAVVVGTSMGGGAAIWSAVEAPELIGGLILVDPFVDGDSNRPLVFLLSLMFARPWGPSMWIKYYSSLYPTLKPADFAGYTAALHANIKRRGRLEALIEMLRASKQASGERLPNVKQPVLVLMGSKDPDFKNPEAEAKRVAEAVRGDFKMIENAGHYPHAEMPEVTAPRIISFLDSLKKGSTMPRKIRVRLDRNAVLQAAVELLNAEGMSALTLSHLAGKLGIQTPSLYNHVDGLTGLQQELAVMNARLLADRLSEAAIGRSGSELFTAVAQAFREYVKEYPGLYRSTLRASGSQPVQDQNLMREEQRAMKIGLAVMASLGLQGEDAIHGLRAFRSMVHGFATLEVAGGFGLPQDCDESFRRLVSALVTGLQ